MTITLHIPDLRVPLRALFKRFRKRPKPINHLMILEMAAHLSPNAKELLAKQLLEAAQQERAMRLPAGFTKHRWPQPQGQIGGRRIYRKLSR